MIIMTLISTSRFKTQVLSFFHPFLCMCLSVTFPVRDACVMLKINAVAVVSEKCEKTLNKRRLFYKC